MAPNLPDEILVNIIKESIEPYDLRVKEDVSSGRLSYIGAPKILHILLVSKKFCEEALTAAKENFTGNLVVDTDFVEDVMFSKIFSMLKDRVGVLSVSKYVSFASEILESRSLQLLLWARSTPNLRKLILTMREPWRLQFYSGIQDFINVGTATKWCNAIVNAARDDLEEHDEILDILQARKFQISLNVFLAGQQTNHDEMAVFVVHAVSDQEGQYTYVVAETWLSKLTNMEHEVRSCETRW